MPFDGYLPASKPNAPHRAFSEQGGGISRNLSPFNKLRAGQPARNFHKKLKTNKDTPRAERSSPPSNAQKASVSLLLALGN